MRKTNATERAAKKATPVRRRNRATDTENEADYRHSQRSIQSGKPIPLSKVLKELGYHVGR